MRRRWWWLVAVALLALALVSPVLLAFAGLEPRREVELRPGVRLVPDGMVNAAIVHAGGAVGLVDCGADRGGTALLAALAREGLHAEDVSFILLTHGHRDHLGGCHLFPRARIYALEPEVPLIEGAVKARGPIPRLRSDATDLQVTVTDPVRDGERLVLGARVFHLPGHTAGSAAWLVNDVLFLGDSAALDQTGRLRGAAWVFSDDPSQNLRSLQALATRLDRLPVGALAFGHSGPALDVTPLLRFSNSEKVIAAMRHSICPLRTGRAEPSPW